MNEQLLTILDEQFNNAIETIKKQHESDRQEIENLYERLKKFNANEEIEALNKELNHTRRNSLMNMSDAEYEADKEFRERHWKMHGGLDHKAVGNTYQYELTGTGIGTVIKITCPICGSTKDITDIDSW